MNSGTFLYYSSVMIISVQMSLPSQISFPPPLHYRHGYEMQEYEAVVPVQVHQDRHLLTPTSVHRKRRSLHMTGSRKHQTHIHINSTHGSFHLDLKQTKNFLAPGFRVIRRKRSENATVMTSVENVDQTCFLTGQVNGKSDSLAKISICDGVRGYLNDGDREFFIEPLHSDSDPEAPRLHALYRVDPTRKTHHQFCDKTTSQERIVRRVHLRRRRHKRDAGRPVGAKTTAKTLTFTNTSRTIRKRRIKDKTVETIVVVDKAMIKRHGEQNIATFVLTVLNMVSKLFHDRTIGKKMNIFLVALILLEADEPGLLIDHNAHRSLQNFCHWQSDLTGQAISHHDHAVLLTGVDICSYQDKPCDTLGFASIQGMCKKYQSCTINEDSGLVTAFTIAHEIGHNLGMMHDGDGNYCSHTPGSIMSPTLAGYNGSFKWSVCSRKYLYSFLRSRQSECLSDEPRRAPDIKFPDKLPGELYGVDYQCQGMFGQGATFCRDEAFANNICRSLWCRVGKYKCETKLLPAAEGTQCGRRRWCRKGLCVPFGNKGPAPIHGGWSSYSGWSMCTRTCGGGVMYRRRVCNTPRPQFGGMDCEGENFIYKLCNEKPCMQKSDFRAEQCSLQNSRQFRKVQYRWQPYRGLMAEKNQCLLYCRAVGHGFSFAFGKVTDGTRCGTGSNKVCVAGACMPFGCDKVINSKATMDECGVCRGDNSTCKHVRGHIAKHKFNQTGYLTIFTIPDGSRDIDIHKLSPHRLHILTSHGRYTFPYKGGKTMNITIAGTNFIYKGHPRVASRTKEKLTAQGPIHTDISVQLLCTGSSGYTQVRFSYTTPLRINDGWVSQQHRYTWLVQDAPCSQTCATGFKDIKLRCMRDDSTEVMDTYCKPERRPVSGTQLCNTQPCPPKWSLGPPGECSVTCGGGVKVRSVRCVQRVSHDFEQEVPDDLCRHLRRPRRKRQLCNKQHCPATWWSGQWTQCNVTCGYGIQRRLVLCIRKGHGNKWKVPAAECKGHPPLATKTCNRKSCAPPGEWAITRWSKCSRTCGEGFRTRQLVCSQRNSTGILQVVANEICDKLTYPNVTLREKCKLKSCDRMPGVWRAGRWSDCSVTCGTGKQTRVVVCWRYVFPSVSPKCDLNTKPEAEKSCTRGDCPEETGAEVCREKAKALCSLVIRYQFCNRKYFRNLCCKSCKDVT